LWCAKFIAIAIVCCHLYISPGQQIFSNSAPCVMFPLCVLSCYHLHLRNKVL
jgi:hypothetical protein